MERHFTPEELSRYDEDPSAADGPAIEAHIRSCESCRETLDVIHSFDEALRSEETWHFADELESATHQQRLGELSQRIAEEDEEAERLLGEHLSTPFAFSGRTSPSSGAIGRAAWCACSPALALPHARKTCFTR